MAKIIGVSGGSGSGKSTFSKVLVEVLEDAYYISADKYFKDTLPTIISPMDNKEYPDWNHPSAVDEKGLVKEILEENSKHKYIIVDGAFIFCIPEVLEKLDFKIFVDATIEMRIFRRIKRNVVEKEQTIEFIGDYYLKCARFREKEFCLPSRKYADFIVDNENGFDSQLEELISIIK